MINDVAYLHYWIALILVICNSLLFSIWAYISGAYRDQRYRMAAINVLVLLMCFAYVLSLNIYARGLRIAQHDYYDIFLSSKPWGIRYLPIIIMLGISSLRLTFWIIDTWRIYQKKRRSGEKWKKRNQ